MIATPDKRLRVFVSSTLEELAPERAAVRGAIERLRLTPVLFEIAARPHPPRELYSAYLDQSDVFVGIYGERYGWVAPDMDVSGLEDELRQAAAKPRLVYVKRPVAGRDPRLQELIDEIEHEGSISYRSFSDANELGRFVEEDLALLLSERFHSQPDAEEEGHAPLPAPVDRFVGRSQELADIETLIRDRHARLVTVTGPGGVGKTRIATEAARRSQELFEDGARFVALASIADAALVPSAIQDVLPRKEKNVDLLLVLDNFEHVIEAAVDVATLLERWPRLTVLVTSRMPLKLRGEHEFRLAPLAVTGTAADDLPDAVALFLERVRAVSAPAEASADRATVADICRRLDGLPLAIELAAAQARFLPPASILERLDRVVAMDAGGGQPERHRTLRAAVAWSFGLLDAAEQAAFASAGVFRGTFGLDAFEVVCGAVVRDADPLELLGSLVEKSLVVRQVDAAPRFSMLETIRDFAVERLEQRADGARAQAAHASFYVELAREAGARLRSEGLASAMPRLDRDENNVRAALEWSLEHGAADDVAAAAWSLVPFWTLRERLAEGRRWMSSVAESSDVSTTARGRALSVASLLAFWQGDYARVAPAASEALSISGSVGDEQGVALAQVGLGLIQCIGGDADAGIALLNESRRLFERAGDEWGVSLAMIGVAWALNITGRDAPLDLFERALERSRDLGYEAETLALGALGRRLALRGEIDEAKRVLLDALLRTQSLDARIGMAINTDLLADLAATEGEDRLAVRLGAAAGAAFAASGAPAPAMVAGRDARIDALSRRLGDTFAPETAAGEALTLEEAVDEATAWVRRRP